MMHLTPRTSCTGDSRSSKISFLAGECVLLQHYRTAAQNRQCGTALSAMIIEDVDTGAEPIASQSEQGMFGSKSTGNRTWSASLRDLLQ